jgi:quinol monooxygenase YgiN
MIVGTLRIVPAPHRRAEVLEIFQAIQGPVVEQPGCLACHVYEEPLPGQAIVLVARWQSQAALEAHLRSELYRQILGAIELSCGPPEVCFDYVSATEGMDLIERSRTPSRTGDEKGTRTMKEPPSTRSASGSSDRVRKEEDRT